MAGAGLIHREFHGYLGFGESFGDTQISRLAEHVLAAAGCRSNASTAHPQDVA